jgi:hypothetical protein
MTLHIFGVLPTFAEITRPIYILMYQSHFEMSDWELS